MEKEGRLQGGLGFGGLECFGFILILMVGVSLGKALLCLGRLIGEGDVAAQNSCYQCFKCLARSNPLQCQKDVG